jgi:hypothetical protein
LRSAFGALIALAEGGRVTLAAVIAAYHEAEEPGAGLRATLPLAGRTVLERQVRLAAAAGAEPVVIAVERVPPELLAAIDRLRAEGLKLVVARSAAEAADSVHPGDRLLLVADGLVAGETHIARLLSLDGHAILTVPDVRVDDRYERIDAYSRWAGLALIDGETLKRTAAMLRDWDLQSTLLRRAVQSGARQIAVRGEPADDQLVVAERSEDLAELQARIFEGATGRRRDLVSRYLLAPLEQAATRLLMPTSVSTNALSLGAALLTALALLGFARGWLWLGMPLLLAATPLDGICERLAALRLQDGEGPSWWSYILPTLSAAALLALAYNLAADNGWTYVAIAVSTIAFALALAIEVDGREVPGRVWLAERKGMAWLLLPFAVMQWWGAGLGLLAAYAAGSFFWAQRQVHRALRTREAD